MTFANSVPLQSVPPIDLPLTLLIVDDQPSVLVALQFVLGDAYRVLSAGSGSQALALAAEQAIDGAIVDLHMPAMNGIEVCERLRVHAAEVGRPLRVWLMSAAAPTEMRRRAIEAGAVGFFEKPFPADLREQLAREFSAETPRAKPSPPATAALTTEG